MYKLTLAGLAALALAATAVTQSKNATLLSQWRPTSGSANDVWGFEDPKTGKPYCMLCTTSGTFILDVSNPAKPINRGFIAASRSGWRSSNWRDCKYWKGYGYVVQEHNGGVQIIDLRNPDRPAYKSTFRPTGVNWPNTHNIALDMQTGYLYACGTRGGMHILDANSTPGTLKYITTYRSPYLHDLSIQDGYVHGADIYGNNYRILDVRNLPTIRFVASARAPGTRYCHNNWATYDRKYSVTTNESAGGPIGIWDIRTLTRPRLIASYRANGSRTAIPHNAYILDYVIHASHYTEGYRAVDMSDPAKPVEVGYYDTWSGSSTGYNGNWGCYPYARSGIQYVSDRTTGLYLVKPAASYKRYGKGTVGTGGKLPHAHLKGAAFLGNKNFCMGVRDAKPNTAAIYVVGGKASSVKIGKLEVLVDFTNPPFLFTTATDSTGASLVPVPVPNDNALNGGRINYQALIFDKGASSLDLAASEGIEFTIFKN